MKSAKNAIIIVSAIVIAILVALLFSKSSEEFDRELTDDIIDDIREAIELPADSVYITIRENVKEPYGDVKYYGWVDGDPESSQYIIYLTYRTKKYNLARILAHEMIHIKQMQSGNLIKHADGSLTFRGKHYTVPQILYMPYNRRPWEIEAEKGSIIVRRFLEVQEADLLPNK